MTGPVLVLHTTEGTTIAGAVAAMRRHRTECHEVVDPSPVAGAGATVQLLTPWDRPARSLRHPAGTPETNNRRPPVYQVEIIGRAAAIGGKPEGWWRNLAAYLAPLCARLGVPRRFPRPFTATDAAYGTGAPQRLTWAAWADVTGIIGHQHVPGNSHWDPGDMNRLALLMPTEGDIVPADPHTTAVQQALTAAGFGPGPVDGIMGPRTAAAVQSMADELERLRSDLTVDADVDLLHADIGADLLRLLDKARPE